MTNRKCFADGARLAQLVQHQTFPLRAMGSSNISGSNGILYVCTFYGNNFFLFMMIENVHNLSNFFQLILVLFSCALSAFLHEEFSAMPIRAKITLMPFSIRMFLLILFVLLRININHKSKMLCRRNRLAQLVEHQTFPLRAMGSSNISGSNGILDVCTLYGNNFFLFFIDRKCSPLLKHFIIITCII